MSLFESIFYMVWRGIAIGVLISAPMGPVGILCIQRTLDKGRKAGLYTGIGAALSDLLYCLLTGFGLSFIEDFIERNQNVIQLVGSAVLIAFSIYLFRKNPSSSLPKPVPQAVSARKNILGGFLFTFSNPLILFLIIGLFARFNFLQHDIKFYHYIIGYLFILIGALGWWYGVTFAIDKVRHRFSLQSMKRINVGIGIVILLFAVVGIITGISGIAASEASAQKFNVSHLPDRRIENNSADTMYFSLPLEQNVSAWNISFTARNLAANPLKEYKFSFHDGSHGKSRLPGWGIAVFHNNGDRTCFFIRSVESPDPFGSSVLASLISSSCIIDNVPSSVPEKVICNHINSAGGENRFKLSFARNSFSFLGGDAGLIPLSMASASSSPIDSLAFVLSPGARLDISDILLRSSSPYDIAEARQRFDNLKSLSDYLNTTQDPVEGFWSLFDYSLDDSLLRLGGDYILASVKRSDGAYEMLYINGASKAADFWNPLMLKVVLEPDASGIPFIYNTTWYDAEALPLSNNIKSQFDADTRTININFPSRNSNIRLIRKEAY